MDDPACDEEKLLRTIDQFESVNFWVSRYRAILKRWVLRDMERNPDKPAHLIDVGAGGCEIAVWLLGEARRRKLSLEVTAIDSDARIVAHARKRYGNVRGLVIQQGISGMLPDAGPADYVFSNHVMHHLAENDLVKFLSDVHASAKRCWVMNDLARSVWSYAGFQLFGRLYRNSFVFEDGKRSIRRGYNRVELAGIAGQAGLSGHIEIAEMMPGRLVVIGRP